MGSPLVFDKSDKSEKSENLNKCPYCASAFTRTSNLKRHIETRCKKTPKMTGVYPPADTSQLVSKEEFNQLKIELEKLKKTPPVQNILNVVCVKRDDNYLDVLTDKWGDFNQALDFIKDCALSSLTGDCKLLNKVYFETKTPTADTSIRYLDKLKSKVQYVDEKAQTVIDQNGQKLSKILANNLQTSYLKGVNYIINDNLSKGVDPSKILGENDIQSWNSHIYELSDHKYQKKIISNLDIPT